MSHQRDDAFDTKRIRKNAAELRALWTLPVRDLTWPRDLFSQQPLTVEQVMMQAAVPQNVTDLCPNENCGVYNKTPNKSPLPHNHRVPMTVPSMYGQGFNVKYFCSDSCKSQYVAKHGRS
jgi:hypothetical protein